MAQQAPSAPLVLAESYRRTSNTLRAQYMRDMLSLFPLLHNDSHGVIDETVAPWLRLVILLVQRYRGLDGALAQQYMTTARLVELGEPGPRVLPGVMPDEQIVRTLLHTGPNVIDRKLADGLTEQQARAAAAAQTLSAGSRLVLDAGRDVVDRTVRADDAALGWMRVTDDDPCAFCAMLASRGAVYKSAESAGAEHDVPIPDGDQLVPGGVAFTSDWHNGCGCQVVPVFTRDPALPAVSVAALDLWNAATTKLPNAERLNAYRRAVEGRPLGPRPGFPDGDPLYGKTYDRLNAGKISTG